jgi:hypothetical protein
MVADFSNAPAIVDADKQSLVSKLDLAGPKSPFENPVEIAADTNQS